MRKTIKHIVAIIVTSVLPYVVVTIFAAGVEGLFEPNLLLVFALPFALIVLIFFVPFVILLEFFDRLELKYTALLGFLLTLTSAMILLGLSISIEKVIYVAMFSLLFGLPSGALYGYIIKNA